MPKFILAVLHSWVDVGKIVNKIRDVKIFDIILAESEKPIAVMGTPNGRLEMRQKNNISLQ